MQLDHFPLPLMVEVKGLNPSHPATNSIEMATEHHDNDVRAFA